jgi:hypothetical protein
MSEIEVALAVGWFLGVLMTLALFGLAGLAL